MIFMERGGSIRDRSQGRNDHISAILVTKFCLIVVVQIRNNDLTSEDSSMILENDEQDKLGRSMPSITILS